MAKRLPGAISREGTAIRAGRGWGAIATYCTRPASARRHGDTEGAERRHAQCLRAAPSPITTDEHVCATIGGRGGEGKGR
jgi:hypothetical protein